MREVTTEKTLIKMWLETIEDGAMQQIKNIANLPFIYKWVAVMPDSHQGYGMPIGGVVALKNVVSPNMVGVDIGCGMCAINTHMKADKVTEEQLKEIMGEVRKVVPVGFAHHQKKQDLELMPLITLDNNVINEEYEGARNSLGTLGGGNHFIEFQKSDEGEFWIMIHSGSRNLGFQVAKYYNDIAKELNKNWYSSVDPKDDLAFLPLNTKEAKAYIFHCSVIVCDVYHIFIGHIYI